MSREPSHDFYRASVAVQKSQNYKRLKARERVVYHGLLLARHEAPGGNEWFQITDRDLAELAGIHRSSIVGARPLLVQAGLIEWKSSGNHKPSKYRVLNCLIWKPERELRDIFS